MSPADPGPALRAVSRLDGYRELLRNRPYLMYLSSAVLASAGYSVYALSVPWLALELDRSFLFLGAVLFVEYGIYTLTFLVAPWIDRARDKRTIFLVCYPLMAMGALTLGFGLLRGDLSPVEVLALVGAISLLWDFAWGAYNVVPALLLPRDQFFRAEGLGGLLGGVTGIAGISVGALLVVVVGPPGGMFLYAFLLVAGTLLALPVAIPSREGPRGERFLAALREGWGYFRTSSSQVLRALVPVELLRGFLFAGPTLLITLIATVSLRSDRSAYGLLYAGWVLGGIALGLALGELNPRRRVGHVLVAALFAEGGATLVAVLLAGQPLVAVVAWFVAGAAAGAYTNTKYSFLRGAFPAGSLARISSNLYLFTGSASALGALLLGSLAGELPVETFGVLVAGGFLLVGALSAVRGPLRTAAF